MSTIACQHVTPSISRDDFELGRMKPLSYNLDDLSRAIVDNTKRLSTKDKTQRQKDALERMKYHGTVNVMKPENYDDLWKWFGFFNDLFFGGLLKDLCRLEIVEEDHDMRKRVMDCDGYCGYSHPGDERDPRYKLETTDCVIVISDRGESYYGTYKSFDRRPRYQNPFVRSKIYLDVLLHEMLHAVFGLYECVREQEYRRECKTDWAHDVFWQAAAQEIEKSVVLGWHPKLHRCGSLVGDLCNGCNLPNAAVLRSLDLDITEILIEQTRQRLFHSPPRRRGSPNYLPLKRNQCIRGDWTVDVSEDAVYERTKWDFWV